LCSFDLVQASSWASGLGGQGSVDVLHMWNPSILGILISLIVLSLVWGTVIAGLILIVRETIEEDDLARFR
jgi:hypothetical protein